MLLSCHTDPPNKIIRSERGNLLSYQIQWKIVNPLETDTGLSDIVFFSLGRSFKYSSTVFALECTPTSAIQSYYFL